MGFKDQVKVSVSELCYYAFFCVLFLAKAVGLYDGQTVFKAVLLLAAFFVLVKMLLTSYDIRELLVSAGLLGLGILIYKNSGEKSALVFLCMMIGFKNIPLERTMRIGLAVWGTGFGLLTLKSILGIGNELVMAHHKFGIDVLRRGMGYPHPNVLHISYAILVVLILFGMDSQNSKRRLKAYLWLIAGNFMIFFYSVSFTGFMLVTFFILFDVYFSYRKKFTFVEKILIQSVFPVCVLFSLFAPLAVEPDTPLFNLLNKVLNRRFYASRLYLQENPLTLFGSRIYASHSFALDSSYVTLLIYGGLVLFALVCIAYIYTIYASMKKRNTKALGLLLSFTIAGVIEPFLFNLSFKNLSLLIIAECFFSLCRGEHTIKLLSSLDKTFNIPVPRLPHTAGEGVPISQKAAIGLVICSLAAGGCYYLAVHMPKTIYVGDKYCDVEGEKYYIDKADYESKDVIFYGYTDKETGLYKFERKTIEFERVRDTVRLIFIVFLAGCAVRPLYANRKVDR